VKKIKGEAEMMKAAAKISKDKRLLADAEEIRDRAVRRIGLLMKAQAKAIGLARGGEHGGRKGKDGGRKTPANARPTLAEAGIDKDLAKRARRRAALNDTEYEAKVEAWRDNMMADETSFAVGDIFKTPNPLHVGVGNNEWHTPENYVIAARDVLGTIDLDPASNAIAQRTVKATAYFNIRQDGLKYDWIGKVFLNPPYAPPLMGYFVNKLCEEYAAGRTTEAIMLANNYGDTQWFHQAANAARVFCITKGRIRFIDAGGNPTSPTLGQAFFYFGNRPQVFSARFSEFGFIATAYSPIKKETP
jgi:DNA N-6-adenine-methyltransferase (Dam)